jgi:hypothetical protein
MSSFAMALSKRERVLTKSREKDHSRREPALRDGRGGLDVDDAKLPRLAAMKEWTLRGGGRAES